MVPGLLGQGCGGHRRANEDVGDGKAGSTQAEWQGRETQQRRRCDAWVEDSAHRSFPGGGTALLIATSLVASVLLGTFPLATANYAGVLSAGYYHTCGVFTDGTARCWGDNSTNQTRVPTEVARFQIFSNKNTTNGTYSLLFNWNKDDNNGTIFNFTDPALGFWIEGNITFENITSWRSISAGYAHTCGLTGNGTVYCWGTGKNYQSLLPQWVMGDPSLEWRTVAAGTGHTCGVLMNGTAACWGANDEGQSTVPAGVDNWKQVDAGYAHSCGVTHNGSLYCWGWNGVTSGTIIPFGQTTPPTISEGWSAVSTGFVHSCGVSASGVGYCWGKDDNGQTDVPQTIELPSSSSEPGSPTVVSVRWKFIDASYFHTCGITVNGTVLCWGNNDAGQSSVPSFAGFDLLQVSTGFVHNCVVNGTGSAYCWGPTPHGTKSYWFLGQTEAPLNLTLVHPHSTPSDFISPL